MRESLKARENTRNSIEHCWTQHWRLISSVGKSVQTVTTSTSNVGDPPAMKWIREQT